MTTHDDRERQRRADFHRAASSRASRRRIAEVLAADAELKANTSTPDDFVQLRTHTHAATLLADAFTRYAHRPCLGVRALEVRGEEIRLLPRFETVSYGEVWQRAVALATVLATEGWVAPGDFVGLYGPTGVDWVVADLACLYLGATSVPLQTSLEPGDLAHIAGETGIRVIVASIGSVHGVAALVRECELAAVVLSDVARHAPSRSAAVFSDVRGWSPDLRVDTVDGLVSRGRTLPPIVIAVPGANGHPDQPLVTVSYTSGSTGRPKGVLYHDRRWVQRMHEALANPPMPYVSVGYMSLAQIGGRLNLLVALVNGGAMYFAPTADLSTLIEDIRLARPTTMIMIPRASGLVYQAFQRALLAAGAPLTGAGVLDTPAAQKIMASMRSTFLGDRLCMVAVGAAPTPPEVIEFLERCFAISVINAYGATELGTITLNGHVRADVEYKLVDVPELGYSTNDKPYPRGELHVKSPYVAPGYFKNPTPERSFADADGFVASGDIVEERGPRTLAWIDRRNNVLRLAQGEFVSITRVEDALVAGGPLLGQAFVYGNPLRAYLLAVIVPDREALREELARRGDDPSSEAAVRRLLRTEIARIASARGLGRHEVPRDFLIEWVPFSRGNGLLTESDKPRRVALRDAYAERLESLYQEIEARQLRSVEDLAEADLSLEEKVVRSALAVLGLEEADVDAAASSFLGLGGDSVGAVRLAQVIERACGRAPSLAAVLDPRLSLKGLAERMRASDHDVFAAVHGNAPRFVRGADLQLERLLPDAASAAQLPTYEHARVVLLTGANGFLGRFLLLELLERLPPDARVVCLVRAGSDEAARERLESQFGADGTPLREDFRRRAAGRLDVHAGDLTQPDLGVAPAVYAALAATVDAIVHNGALVNHALSYRALFEPNVLGTVEVMRLATRTRRKRIVFVSSIGVVAGVRRDGPILEDEPLARIAPHWVLPPDDAPNAYGLGYSTSKWAGELLLAQLARHGVPVTVVRCGLLLAHRRYPGQINEADALSRLVLGIARTGLAPTSFYPPEHAARGHVDGLPVDLVATSIATITTSLRGDATFHACSDRTAAVSLDRIVDWIEAAGIAIERRPYEAWFTEFRERLGKLDDATRRRSPLAIIDRWRAPADPAAVPRLDATRFAALAPDRTSTIDEAFVRRWLADLGVGA